MKKKRIIAFLIILVFCVSYLLFAAENNFISGYWYYYNDKSNNGSSKIVIDNEQTLTFKFIKEKIGGKNKDVALLAGEVTIDYVYGFIGMGIKLSESGKNLMKKAKGIKFKIIGDGKVYRCKLDTTNVKDFDCFGYNFKSTPNVSVIEIPFSKMKQEGWGETVGFNKSLIWQIQFQTVGQPHKSVFLKVFDLEIIP